MAKVIDTVGLSRELIIHPGETLSEVLDERGMSQRELAYRTGVSEKHISTVISGQKNISADFAKKLEYALGIEYSFWMNLQTLYDRELIEYKEKNCITDKELSVLDDLKEVTDIWASFNWIDDKQSPVDMIIDYRRLLRISNLLDVPKMITFNDNHFQDSSIQDPYVFFAWRRMCEMLTADSSVSEEVSLNRLREKIPEIKQVMFMRSDRIGNELKKLFAECGIIFMIVPSLDNLPVQGFISNRTDGALVLCMCIKQKYADVFWLTLFHEIAHILNGDVRRTYIDLYPDNEEREKDMDKIAFDYMIDSNEYKAFIESEKYKRTAEIEKFARTQKIKDYMVKGRLSRELGMTWKERQGCKWV